MYLAMYMKEVEGENGPYSTSGRIYADTLEELKQKAAATHYEDCFQSNSGFLDEDEEQERGEGTWGWKVYKFQENLNVDELPEFLTMVEERAKRCAALAEKKREEEERKKAEHEKSERELYERLKAKYVD